MLTVALWQLAVLLLIFGAIILFAVYLGAYMVFRTKHAQMGIPFLQKAEKKTGQPEHYASELFEDQDFDILDEDELSEAAIRLREQKEGTTILQNTMAHVTGKPQEE